ncbi:MAG: hypothetical protein LBT27_03465 [Prevotellaceae bacterium]|jgi:Flp pilus assembly protein TadB|nr:hypothetical protein [Prevotellaceae bacterium]
MSKIIDNLLPEDFGKSFDATLFAEWKKSANEHEQAGITSVILWFIGFAALLLLGGLVGLGIFFILMFVALGISLPKQNKRKKYQNQLGISNKDFRTAIAAAKKRTK